VTTGDKTLRIERTFDAPIERVFDAWTTPEVMRRWWQAEAGWSTSQAEVDLRVGGAIRVGMYDPDRDKEIGGGGKYTEVDRPDRLAFTWFWDGETHRTLIQIDFEETAAGTKVTFVHDKLWDEETVKGHHYGWSNVLDSLGRDLAAHA
jgi:uncharacterized protein YndB with AHSA1/START domain